MFKVVTQYKATSFKGGYVLQWEGRNCPSYVVGRNQTCGWFKLKADAIKRAEELNKG